MSDLQSRLQQQIETNNIVIYQLKRVRRALFILIGLYLIFENEDLIIYAGAWVINWIMWFINWF